MFFWNSLAFSMIQWMLSIGSLVPLPWHIKKQRHHIANKRRVKAMVFPVVMWELNRKEGWAPKNWCLWIVVLGKILESLLDSKEIKSVNPKGNPPWIFVGRTDAEAEVPILWPPDVKRRLIGKDFGTGKDWGKRRRRGQKMRWLDSITDSMEMNLSKL